MLSRKDRDEIVRQIERMEFFLRISRVLFFAYIFLELLELALAL